MLFVANRNWHSTLREVHASPRALSDILITPFTKLHVFIRSSVEMNKLWRGSNEPSAQVSAAGDCLESILV